MPKIKMPKGTTLADKLFQHTAVDENGCWIWQGYVNPQGYGMGGHYGRNGQIHRLAYEEFVGPIPDGMTVDHTCFVTSCANPAYLRLLTNEENARTKRWQRFAPDGVRLCFYGHRLDPENIFMHSRGPGLGKRPRCIECRRRYKRQERARRASRTD